MTTLSLSTFISYLFQLRPQIEQIVIAIDPPYKELIFTYQAYPSIKFTSERIAKYLKYAKEIPDAFVYQNLQTYAGNEERTLENIFLLLLKKYKELVFLYKACEIGERMMKQGQYIEYDFRNPLREYGFGDIPDCKIKIIDLIEYRNARPIEGSYLFSNILKTSTRQYQNEDTEEDSEEDDEEEPQINIQMQISK